jgi:hypothetical protein
LMHLFRLIVDALINIILITNIIVHAMEKQSHEFCTFDCRNYVDVYFLK